MAFPKRIDANQKQITSELRKLGVSVWITSALGKGSPDMVIGVKGINLCLEIKDGSKPESARRLTPLEDAFHKSWQGQICVVKDMADVKALLDWYGYATV